MNKMTNLTLGQIVKQDYRTAAVFEKFSMDFFCRGFEPFGHACHAANVDPALVAKEEPDDAHLRQNVPRRFW